MDRHAVPQNIMEVEFKLFGSLTVRQFAYLAAGFLIALVIYYTSLQVIFKYPLIFISCISGLFFSVGQINGQSSTVWVGNFIAAMFTSQERVWKKTAITPEIFKDELLKSRKTSDTSEIVGRKRGPTFLMRDAPLLSLPEEVVTEQDTDIEMKLKNIESHLDFIYKDLPNNYKSQIKPPDTSKIITNVNNKTPIIINIDDQKSEHVVTIDRPNLRIQPNIISGIVLNKDMVRLNDSQIFIKNNRLNLVRKVITDENGRFTLTTPLSDGEYYIDIESGTCKFPRYKVILNGIELPVYKFVES